MGARRRVTRDVEAAARAVGAHEFIARLAGGYHHELTERGRSLSSGQRQLIALARAELVDPVLLLLDEATSNLDLATEARVAAAMHEGVGGSHHSRDRSPAADREKLPIAWWCCTAGRWSRSEPMTTCSPGVGGMQPCGLCSTTSSTLHRPHQSHRGTTAGWPAAESLRPTDSRWARAGRDRSGDQRGKECPDDHPLGSVDGSCREALR